MPTVLPYDHRPCVDVPGFPTATVRGWDAIGDILREAVRRRAAARTVVAVEAYPGVDEDTLARELTERLHPARVVRTADAFERPEILEARVAPFLGGGDPVFGRLTSLSLPDFFAPDRLATSRAELARVGEGLILVIGVGAMLWREPDLLVYADLPRREAQLRFRRGASGNLGVPPTRWPESSPATKYQRAFFVDWRVADRWKRPLIVRWDFVLDTTEPGAPKCITGEAVRAGLRAAVTRPFRVVPYFDPAPWGGQWLKTAFSLDPAATNYGWGFDCVPEENSLLLGFGDERCEIPSLNLVFAEPHALLGDAVHARFGAEFPIRFDFLDTIQGGNLSLQVHPRADYIRSQFGMPYTQDESYYLLQATPEAAVYLGLRDGVDRTAFADALRAAQTGGPPFPAGRYAQRWPARKHDHFLIPAGTLHCSGAGALVLEISATPYIFTFKLWDWGRLGLDGRPRPIHLEHGLANLAWERTPDWTGRELVNAVTEVARGDGWREERTGLHASEFIETRRHWFHGPVAHHTAGTVNVLNLVEGSAAVVESPSGAFAPFPVNYAETFIVPAAVGAYTIRPVGPGEHATLKAFVRD